jgi:6-pyruvoyl-tetrahydropterin synthase
MDEILLSEFRRFAASHFHSMKGFNEPLHGHTWGLEATVRADAKMLLGPILDEWIAKVENTVLNGQDCLNGRNPTAEVLAECAFLHLKNAGLCPVAVKIWEKSNCWASCAGIDN